jgi:hypothetical protein
MFTGTVALIDASRDITSASNITETTYTKQCILVHSLVMSYEEGAHL